MIPTCQQVTFTHQPTLSQHRMNKRIRYVHINIYYIEMWVFVLPPNPNIKILSQSWMKRIFPHSFDLGHHHEGFFEYILVTLYTNQTKKTHDRSIPRKTCRLIHLSASWQPRPGFHPSLDKGRVRKTSFTASPSHCVCIQLSSACASGKTCAKFTWIWKKTACGRQCGGWVVSYCNQSFVGVLLSNRWSIAT